MTLQEMIKKETLSERTNTCYALDFKMMMVLSMW